MRVAVALDTSVAVALFNRFDEDHEAAKALVRDHRPRFITNLAVVTETTYLLNFHPAARLDFLQWIRACGTAIFHPEPADFERVAELMSKYADLPMDFCDALIVMMCERLQIDRVATLDRDFSVYRLHGRRRFRNLWTDR